MPPVSRSRRGRPRRRPRELFADRGYDHDIYRHRRRTRYEHRAAIPLGLPQLAHALICYRQLCVVVT